MDKSTLSEGAKKYGADESELQLLGGFSNNVFECNRNGDSFVLKFYPSTAYRKDSIIAELDWIGFLHSSGVNVTSPLLSRNGNHMETIKLEDKGECYVLAFQKAKGSFINVNDPEIWNEKLYNNLGQTLGKIHCLSKSYSPSEDAIKRKDWNMGALFSGNFDGVNTVVLRKWEEFVAELSKLSMDKSGYGMIHNDLHQGNYYVHNNEIILFDFGDCEYNWFVYNIAIVLYHAVQSIDGKDTKGRKEFANLFIRTFLEGYLTENNLDQYWLSKLQFFLNYRRIYSYIYFVTFLTKEQKHNGYVREKLADMKFHIERDIPFLEL